ncbi:MAG TPA: response regulator [Polyangiaceae bacterium]|nr:response regulator [Polyangiaceae bacterium]
MSRTSINQPATILVVDDSEVVLTVTKALLEAVGYRVLTHSGPAGCVAMILQEKPDLLLIDVNMPKLGGETIVKLFGKAQPNSETIILLFSTLPADQLEQRARASGAHGFIRKTEDTFELVRQVNRWLRAKDPATTPKRAPAVEVAAMARPPASGPRVKSGKTAPPPAGKRYHDVREARTSGTVRLSAVALFVDDDMTALSAYRRDVQGEAYRADFALSAAHALRHIDSETPPGVIVARLEPAGIDVYERALALDANWKNRFVFVVGSKRSARASAFLDNFRGPVLHHPIEAEPLRRAIRQLLNVSAPANERILGG